MLKKITDKLYSQISDLIYQAVIKYKYRFKYKCMSSIFISLVQKSSNSKTTKQITYFINLCF